MDKITFKNNAQPAINDTNLNLMQDNIEKELKNKEEKIEETKTTLENFTAKLQYSKRLVLGYNASTNLQGVISDIPDLAENKEKYLVSLSIQQQSGTPYSQVDKLTYEIRDNNWLVINAYGSGFVQGHMLTVSVIVYKLD